MCKIKKLLEKYPRILMAGSGFLLGITVILSEIGFLAYLAIIPLAFALFKFRLKDKYSLRKAYLDGFVFYICYDLVCFYWFLYFYPLDFLGLTDLQSLGVVLLAWLGLSILQSLFSAFVFVLISLFARTAFFHTHPITLCIYAGAVFSVNEWTQTLTWAGIPWARISLSQTALPPLMQTASLFGSYFLTFIIVLVNFLLAYAIINIEKRRLAVFLALGVFLLNAAVGSVLCCVPTCSDDGFEIALLQGNLPLQENTDMTPSKKFEIYDALTRKAADDGAQMIIWPENTIATHLDINIRLSNNKITSLKNALVSLAVETGTTLIVGHFSTDEDGNRYNSLSAFYSDGSIALDVYAKIRIVPFGEYVPMRSFIEAVFPILGDINFFGTDSTPGKESTSFSAFNTEDSCKISALICFDSIYEKLGIDSVRAGGQIFIVPSNDSWFYDSRALNMHHAQNILRAVEQGRYTLNAGNTGLTSVVTDKGVIKQTMPILTEGYIVETVFPSSFRTLYSYIGNTFVYICIALLSIPIFGLALQYIRHKKKGDPIT